MENIFENTYFGKVYKTRDGRKAIYTGKIPSTTLHKLLVEGALDTLNYDEFGSLEPNGECFLDIVSEWEEPINEEKLDDLAWEYADFHYGDGREITIQDIVSTYKTGFRTKAKI